MPRHSVQAIAIVGVGAVLPDAPDAPTFWRNVQDGRYSISEAPRRPLGPRAATATPIPRRPTRPTRRSAAGSATGPGTRSAGSCPIPPRVGDSMDRTPEVGAWPPPARRSPTTAGRPAPSTRTAPRSSSATPWPGERHYHHRAAARRSRSIARGALRRLRASRRLPSRPAPDDHRRAARRPRSSPAGDHRGHDAGRAVEHHRRPGREPVQLPRPQLRRRRRLRLGHGRARRRHRGPRRGRLRRRAHRRHRRQHGRRRRSSSSARSARSRPPAPAPTPTAPTAS